MRLGPLDGVALLEHGKQRPLLCPRTVGFAGNKGSVAGINCFDWSSMGMRYGWLAWSVAPDKEFCREALLDDDLDWIIG